ncbi:alpha-ketoglutarate decarboxylase [Winogradskyella sp. F6397]|uniref:Alpha-ketoglutarate decarboxylase n=1 Tax=Winogradskyella marina TaxID=2785530 RepID=A0ABS0EHF6_9FLAO|nr:alpha-ketoglutarate decarboxylase [Winogradskyella marina]MBF8149869.1 alpha-ketoglutarate decarboxylase [Winogradskyella marina]
MTNLKDFRRIKLSLCTFLICFSALLSFAQEHTANKNSFWSHVEYGGGIGLNFGDGFFSGSLAPNALYRFNPYVATGIGLNFSYSSQKDVFKSTVLGGSLIGLFNPYREVQISTEFEQLHVSRKFDDRYTSFGDEEYWYPALFIGAGYSSGNVTIGIRYDVLYDKDKSIYSEAWMPFVRFRF